MTDSSIRGKRGSITAVGKLFQVNTDSELSIGGGVALTSTGKMGIQNEDGVINVPEGGFSINAPEHRAILNRGTFNGNNIPFTATNGRYATLTLETGTVTNLNANAANTGSGRAIEVGDDTYDWENDVTITGGTYSAAKDYALYVMNQSRIKVALKGGTFSSDQRSAISYGGEDYADLLAEGYGYTPDNGQTFFQGEACEAARYLSVMETNGKQPIVPLVFTNSVFLAAGESRPGGGTLSLSEGTDNNNGGKDYTLTMENVNLMGLVTLLSAPVGLYFVRITEHDRLNVKLVGRNTVDASVADGSETSGHRQKGGGPQSRYVRRMWQRGPHRLRPRHLRWGERQSPH